MRKRISTAILFASIAAMALTQVAMAMHQQVRSIVH